MAFKLIIRDAKETGAVDVYLYGNISQWSDEVSPSKVAQQIKDLEKKYTKCIIHINSNGGEVFQGIAIHKILSDTNMELEICVDGVAASMAAVLVQVPNAKRVMGKYSKMMLHSPSGYVSGNSEEMRQYAQMMDDFETTLVNIIADRCGFDSKEVRNKWFDKKDHWLTAQQALDEGLIDEIVDGIVTTKAPKNLIDSMAIYNFYEEQISHQNNNEMDFTKLLAKLGLAANSTEDQALDFVSNVVAENQTLKTKLTGLESEVRTLKDQAEAARKADIKNLIDTAVAAKKITEDQRPVYQALFEKDFDNAKAVLDSIPAYKPLTAVPSPDAAIPGIPEDRKDWTFTDWQKKDGKGLTAMKTTNVEAFKALYKKSFDKEPIL
jgi:ATP-dependent Clp endopeptidase proteolytic subunit ClpP